MAGLWRNVNDKWKKGKGVWRNVNGTWKKGKAVWRNVNGVWKKMSFAIEVGSFGGGNGVLGLLVGSKEKNVVLKGATSDKMASTDPAAAISGLRFSTLTYWGYTALNLGFSMDCRDGAASRDLLNSKINVLQLTIIDRATKVSYSFPVKDLLGNNKFSSNKLGTVYFQSAFFDKPSVDRIKVFIDNVYSKFSNNAQIDVILSYEE